jgi:deazaflavin-dependent oxidoreductase (nitroreductase family)
VSAGDALGEELAAWGKVVLLTTRGRRSGLPRRTPVGFIEEPDGSLLVSAGGHDTQWARNLLAEPRCEATRDGKTHRYRAEPLRREEHEGAVRELILRYGTPAERLGDGPSFRLVPDGGGMAGG